MTHLLDTNICSAHMRRPAGLAHRFFQYAGRIAISSVVLAELYAGAYGEHSTQRLPLPHAIHHLRSAPFTDRLSI